MIMGVRRGKGCLGTIILFTASNFTQTQNNLERHNHSMQCNNV